MIGAESCTAKTPAAQDQILIQHLLKLRTIPGLEEATIVFVPESNLAFEGTRITAEVQRAGIQNVCVMNEDENRAGVRSTASTKKMMAFVTGRALSDRRVRFHEQFLCVNEATTAGDLKKMIIDELRSYQRVLKQPSDHRFGTVKEAYTGKIGSGCDDHAIAFQINYAMQNVFFSKRDTYKAFY